MKRASEHRDRPLPGVVATLSAGLELTTSHLWLTILPISLDLFFWLGPRLSVSRLVERNASVLLDEPALADLADLMERSVELAEGVNLFTSLHLPLIGIPALMGDQIPEKTPVVSPVIEVGSPFDWFIWFGGLSLVGLLLTTFYLTLIARTIRGENRFQLQDLRRFVPLLTASYVRLLGLGFVFLLLLSFVSLLLLPVALVVALLGGGLFLLVMIMGLLLVTTYLSMAVPGIVLSRRTLLRSVVDSIRMVHRQLSTTVALLLSVVLISRGMNLLWHLADNGSWLTLASIAGHGFISTGLAATIFIFYRDRAAPRYSSYSNDG